MIFQQRWRALSLACQQAEFWTIKAEREQSDFAQAKTADRTTQDATAGGFSTRQVWPIFKG